MVDFNKENIDSRADNIYTSSIICNGCVCIICSRIETKAEVILVIKGTSLQHSNPQLLRVISCIVEREEKVSCVVNAGLAF